jgi:hypothetical protein
MATSRAPTNLVASARDHTDVAHRLAQWRRYQDRYEPERLIFIATSIIEARRYRDLDRRSSWTISAAKTPKPYACPFAPLALIILGRTRCRNDLRRASLTDLTAFPPATAQIILKFLGLAQIKLQSCIMTSVA